MKPTLEGSSALDVVTVHIGVGHGALGRSGSGTAGKKDRIVLVDADRGILDRLAAAVGDSPSVEIICEAVSGANASRTYFECNLSKANGLNPPSGILELYPGLRVVGRRTVRTKRISRLLAELGLLHSSPNRLVLDVNGEERSILEDLAGSVSLQAFDSIEVRCGQVPLFESSMTVAEVHEWMDRLGYDLKLQDDSTDPDLPRLVFQRSSGPAQIDKLHAELARERSRAARLEADLESTKRAAARSDNLTVRLDEMSLEARRRGDRIGDLERQLADLGRVNADLSQQLQASELRCEEQQQEMVALREEVDRLAQASRQSEELQSTLEEQSGRLDEFERTAAENDRRQRLMDDELVRAEAQLDLIADVLLREKLS